MLSRAKLTSAEIYRTAMDRASEVVPQYNQMIRLNHMIVTDDGLAQQLARAGRPLTMANLPEVAAAYDDGDLFGDYVRTGAWLSFCVLQRVIDPSNRVFGPGNFSIVPCDTEGKPMPVDGNFLGGQLKAPRSSFGQPLGEQREDYYQAAAVGIASRIATEGRETRPKAIQKAAEVAARQDCNAMAYHALAMAAVHANTIIGPNQATILASNDGGLGKITLGVLVEPLPGHEVSADTPYDRVIPLDF